MSTSAELAQDYEGAMVIEADSDYDEVSSQYDSCYSSASECTTTLISEVTNYKYENGRRYHSYAEGHYWCPNDEQQNTQLDIFHHVYTLGLDGHLFLAPIGPSPSAILDLGTGTGIWAIEMAERFPSARIIGNDLSPIQPVWVPANATFEVDDFTRPWLHPPDTFDFIHARALYGSVADWPALLSEAYHALAPGGWFESVETTCEICSEASPHPDGSMDASMGVLGQWGVLAKEAGERTGKSFKMVGKVKNMLEEAGFVETRERMFKLPIGPWAKSAKMKELGRWGLVNMLEACEGFTLALWTRTLGWSIEDTLKLVEEIGKELKVREKRLYLKMYVTYGRKPLEDVGREPSPMDTDGHSLGSLVHDAP